jgi:hypothetical protein
MKVCQPVHQIRKVILQINQNQISSDKFQFMLVMPSFTQIGPVVCGKMKKLLCLSERTEVDANMPAPVKHLLKVYDFDPRIFISLIREMCFGSLLKVNKK